MSCDGIACCTCTVMCAVGISRTRVDAKRGVSQSDTLVALVRGAGRESQQRPAGLLRQLPRRLQHHGQRQVGERLQVSRGEGGHRGEGVQEEVLREVY